MNDKRLAQLTEMQAADPDDPFIQYAIGLEHLNGGDISVAIERFKELSTAHPDYVPTYYQFAVALVQTGQVNEAIGVLEQGIEVAQKAGERKTVNELRMMLEDLED